MSVVESLTPELLTKVRAMLKDLRCDGWLLFDFHGLNPVATRVLGIGGLATRRLFVLLPAVGDPIAIAHKIETGRIEGFPGQVRTYAAWRELEQHLKAILSGKRVAMEYSAKDAVPYLDRVPAGVVELVRASGAEVAGSAELVTAIAARWSPAELEGHRKAAEQLRTIALEAFQQVKTWHQAGQRATEQGLQKWVMEAFGRAGLETNSPPIVGVDAHAANPHYEPHLAGSETEILPGQVLLLDLWAGVTRDTVYADQTWMCWTGGEVPAEVAKVWKTVTGARDAAVQTLRDKWHEGWSVSGAELDDASRNVIKQAGYGDFFVHRTGHSIDKELHGSGPHLDNYETHDDRKLMAGIGFSVEPGIYLPGRFGMRTEINVVLHDKGPEVTPAEPQQDLVVLGLQA